MSTPNLPAAWADAVQLDGLDLIDKAALVGKPFRITSVHFESNQRGVSYVYVDAEDVEGEAFTFNDSSSGIRAQIVSHLTGLGKDNAVDSPGEIVDLSLVIPRGLRVSEYEVRDDRGKAKTARTYYLTTSGRRAGAASPTPPKKK